jgi:NAD(P)H-dependent FMN reductase
MTQHTPLPIRIQVIIGSIREGRAADAVSRWTLARANALPGAVIETLDLREWQLPHFAETFTSLGDPVDPTFSTCVVRDWSHRIADADAYIFIPPSTTTASPAC